MTWKGTKSGNLDNEIDSTDNFNFSLTADRDRRHCTSILRLFTVHCRSCTGRPITAHQASYNILLTLIWVFHHVAHMSPQLGQICGCPGRIGRHRNRSAKCLGRDRSTCTATAPPGARPTCMAAAHAQHSSVWRSPQLVLRNPPPRAMTFAKHSPVLAANFILQQSTNTRHSFHKRGLLLLLLLLLN